MSLIDKTIKLFDAYKDELGRIDAQITNLKKDKNELLSTLKKIDLNLTTNLKDALIEEILKSISVEDILSAVTTEDIINSKATNDIIEEIPTEEILEILPIEELVDYVLEQDLLVDQVRYDKNATFKLLSNLDYDDIKEWLALTAKYKLHP